MLREHYELCQEDLGKEMTTALTEKPEALSDSLSNPGRASTLAVLQLLDPLCIATRISVPTANTKYNALVHSELCRLKMLGFNDKNCAKAIGVLPETLRKWFSRYPQLETDMEQASQLAKAEVATLLFKCMEEPGPVGLNAIKFFLSTRTDEFTEKAKLEVSTSGDTKEIENAIRSVYGIELPDSSAPQLPEESN